MNAVVIPQTNERSIAALLFRIVLFAAGATLAAYIPFKYVTQLHAVTGIYAFLFPLSSLLALAGMVLAIRPQTGCDCSTIVRTGAGGLAILWLATGLLCIPSLAETMLESPAGGAIASGHMLLQHIFLSLSILAFAVMPRMMADKLGGAKLTH